MSTHSTGQCPGSIHFGIVTRFVLGIFFSLLASPLLAQQDAFDLHALEKHVNQTLERDRVPGAIVVIVRGSEVLYMQGFGEDGHGRPVDKNTRFLIGSMSKAFTAMVAMRLAEAGRIEFEAAVDPHVPELKGQSAGEWSKVTLRHLLTHTSGIPTRTPVLPPDATLLQQTAALAGTDLESVPGSRHVYSSSNYLLAARMMETATGTEFGKLLEELVLGPLGIKATTPQDIHQSMGRRYWFVWPRRADLPASPGRLATATVSASAADMANFLLFQLGDGTWGGKRIVSQKGLAEMHKGGAQGDGFTYGFGWRNVDHKGVLTVQHGGVLPNYHGKMILLPEQDAAVAVLTNVSSVLPLPLRPTGHELANDIALYLAGGPLGLPNLGYQNWLIVFWSGMSLMLLQQIISMVRLVVSRRPDPNPLRSSILDLLMVLAFLTVLPWFVGMSLPRIADQTPDMALWLGAMSLIALSATALRLVRLARS